MAPKRKMSHSIASIRTPSADQRHGLTSAATKSELKSSTAGGGARKSIAAVDRDLSKLERRFGRFKDRLRELCAQLSDNEDRHGEHEGEDEAEDTVEEDEQLVVTVGRKATSSVRKGEDEDDGKNGTGSGSDYTGSDIVITYSKEKGRATPLLEGPPKKKKRPVSKIDIGEGLEAETPRKGRRGTKKQRSASALSALERKRKHAPSRRASEAAGSKRPAYTEAATVKKALVEDITTDVATSKAVTAKPAGAKSVQVQSSRGPSGTPKSTPCGRKTSIPKLSQGRLTQVDLKKREWTRKELLGPIYIPGLDSDARPSSPEVRKGKAAQSVKNGGGILTADGRKQSHMAEPLPFEGLKKGKERIVSCQKDGRDEDENIEWETDEEEGPGYEEDTEDDDEVRPKKKAKRGETSS